MIHETMRLALSCELHLPNGDYVGQIWANQIEILGATWWLDNNAVLNMNNPLPHLVIEVWTPAARERERERNERIDALRRSAEEK